METKINIISDSEHELEAVLTYEEIQPDIEEAYKAESKKLEIPGFRKGKVPMHMVKKMFGEAIEYKATEKIAGKKFWDIADEQKLNPISAPKIVDINFERGVKLEFKIRYEVLPNIEAKDYTGNEIKKIVWKVNDQIIDDEIQYLRRTNSTQETTEAIEDKNNIIDVRLTRLNTTENVSENVTIDLSDNRVNPELVESALNKKIGEKFTFNVPQQNTQGEKVEGITEELSYEAEVLGIKKLILPEWNDELVQKITNDKFKTIEEWKTNLTTGLQSYYDRQSDDLLINSLMSTVISNNKFEPPHGYVHILLDRMVEIEADKAKREGNKKVDTHELHHKLHPRAEYTAKWQILSKSIAEKENIKVDESQLEEIAEKESAETGISKEKLIKFYKDSNRLDAMLEDKIIDFLKNNNNIKEVRPEELNKKD